MVAAWSRRRLLGVARVSAVAAINMLAGAVPAAAATTRSRPVQGHDVSFPQCSRQLPAPGAVAVVGVNGGAAFSANPCLASRVRLGRALRGRPRALHEHRRPRAAERPLAPGGSAPLRRRRPGLPGRELRRRRRHRRPRPARAAGAHSVRWWLDIEVVNSWAADPAQNVAVIQGAAAVLRSRGAIPGVYSTAWQWAQITGGWRVAMPNWLGGAGDPGEAASHCASAGFSGGPVQLVQYPTADVDGDVRCHQ